MTNELLFLLHSVTISTGVMLFARLGKSALISYITLLFLMANIFVIKQINLFGFCVTSVDAFIVGISLSCNILQEFYGRETARKAVLISFASCIGYMIITKIIVSYNPADCDNTHLAFAHITANIARITIASFAAYLITQILDIQIYALLKKITKSRFFVLRNYAAITISQLTDTILFSLFGLYGIVDNIFDIITISFAIKIIAIVLTTPFLILIKSNVSKNDF